MSEPWFFANEAHRDAFYERNRLWAEEFGRLCRRWWWVLLLLAGGWGIELRLRLETTGATPEQQASGLERP